MKKAFLLLLAAMLSTIVLFSCSDNDDVVTPETEKEVEYSPFGIWKCTLPDGNYCMLYSIIKTDGSYVGMVTYGGKVVPGGIKFQKTQFTFASDSTGTGLVLKGVFADGKQNQFTGTMLYAGQPMLSGAVFYRQSDFNKPTVSAQFEVEDTASQITPYQAALQAVVEKYNASEELSGMLSTKLQSAVTFFVTKKATCDTLAKKQVQAYPVLSMTSACVKVKLSFIYDLLPESYEYRSYYNAVK